MASSEKKPSDSVLQLPLICDKRTIMYVKFAKVMIIIQGSISENINKLASEFQSVYKSSCRVISDETYKSETGLSFVKEKTEDFYQYLKSKVKKTCEDGYNLIVIKQSMSNSNQIKYYMFLAQKFQYVVLPVPPLVTEENRKREYSKSNQASSFSRDAKIECHNLFNHRLCGWFLHDVDSAELRQEVTWYVRDCFEGISEFDDLFSRCCKPDSFKTFYQMDDTRQELAFCLVKILKSPIEAVEYTSKEIFKKFYGKMAKLYVVGFIVTPYIVAARVKLTYDQRQLWMLPDDLSEKFKTEFYPSDLIKQTKVYIEGESVNLICSKSNRTLINGDMMANPEEAIPHNMKGRSCHILLGKVKTASKRSINYDVPFAVHRERTVATDPMYQDKVVPYDLARCKVRRIGKYWFIYLKETIIVNGFFATYCEAESNIV